VARDGSVWVGTDGAVADEPSAGSGQPIGAKSADGRLWFPTAHGMMSFQPGALTQKTRLAAVAVEEIWVDGAVQTVRDQAKFILPLSVKRVEFHFTSAELEMPGRLKFRYRLQGFDDGWMDAGSQRVAYYGHLPAGDYQFRVMAGLDNNWREADAPLSVRVVPRFWETRWFQISGLVLVVALVAGIARYVEREKLHRRLERLELQQAMEKERHRIAQDLHDDLGSGITEIMLLGELAKQEAAASVASQSQVATITDKVRHLAAAMDEVVWTVSPKNDSLSHLASYICDYAREFFSASPVRCRIDMKEGLPVATLSAHVRHNLFLAVKEALNNVAKHSAAGEVWLRIQQETGRLMICVEDDGKGFDFAATANHGNGLQNMRARLKAIGGQTEICGHLPRGTCVKFQVTLPPSSLN
jgi:signal transduction histidine kinase